MGSGVWRTREGFCDATAEENANEHEHEHEGHNVTGRGGADREGVEGGRRVEDAGWERIRRGGGGR